ncbi:NAD(P)-binding protein [Poronia punctata]|nr:NAD(P)-binding protein [Poronia punctata]
MSSPKKLIAIIGGTGAQGMPIVRDLVRSGTYSARVLTRDITSARFKELQSYGPGSVEGVMGSFASEDALRDVFRGAWGAFAWELALEEGVKFYIHGNLDYGYKLSGFRPEFRCGHYDAKGRMAEWILLQNKQQQQVIPMRSAVFTTGPYIEMTIGKGTIFAPEVDEEDGVVVWRVPLGNNGAVPFTAVDDCGVYVKYLFDNHDQTGGVDLRVALAHVTFGEYVQAFTKVTGKPARWEDTPDDVDGHLRRMWGERGDLPCGYNSDPDDPATMSLRKNFTGWFNLWRHSGENKGLVRRDYALLDEIFPDRIKSVEEWIRREDEKGVREGLGSLWERIQPENLGHVLKLTEDKRQGKL